MNTIQLIGRLTDHPKLEETKTGKHVCKECGGLTYNEHLCSDCQLYTGCFA